MLKHKYSNSNILYTYTIYILQAYSSKDKNNYNKNNTSRSGYSGIQSHFVLTYKYKILYKAQYVIDNIVFKTL